MTSGITYYKFLPYIVRKWWRRVEEPQHHIFAYMYICNFFFREGGELDFTYIFYPIILISLTHSAVNASDTVKWAMFSLLYYMV